MLNKEKLEMTQKCKKCGKLLLNKTQLNLTSLVSSFNLKKENHEIKDLNYKDKSLIEIYIEKSEINIIIAHEELCNECKNKKENPLEEIVLKDKKENIVNPYRPQISYLKDPYEQKQIYSKQGSNIDPISGATVHYVSPSQLPSGYGWKALGMYDPSTHTIYIADNLPYNIERFVYHHEVSHALGTRNEQQADNYASSKVGYNIRNAA